MLEKHTTGQMDSPSDHGKDAGLKRSIFGPHSPLLYSLRLVIYHLLGRK